MRTKATFMKILILGYSDLSKRKLIPVFQKSKIKFCICSKSQKYESIGAYDWYRNYNKALKKANADIVYISFGKLRTLLLGKKIFKK